MLASTKRWTAARQSPVRSMVGVGASAAIAAEAQFMTVKAASSARRPLRFRILADKVTLVHTRGIALYRSPPVPSSLCDEGLHIDDEPVCARDAARSRLAR